MDSEPDISKLIKPKMLSDDFTLLREVNFGSLPKPEMLASMHLVFQVPHLLNDLISDFGTARDIYDFAYPRFSGSFDPIDTAALRKWISWMNIAGRDGAQTIYHFVMLIQETNSITLRKCPTINALISRQRRNRVNELIRLHFRHWQDLRDAVAHRVEFQQSMDRIAQHVPDDGKHFGQDGWTRSTFKVHNKKRTLHYELSETTQQELSQIREAFCDLFRKP